MAWMYLTPIIYPESIVPERYRPFINANPFTALVRSYRRIFLEGPRPTGPPRLLYSLRRACFLFLVTGGLRRPAVTSPCVFNDGTDGSRP